jgi:Holliday junction DNA helicase RuvA
MFEFFRGVLADKSPGLAVVDVQGVGYLFEIPLSTFQQLPAAGAEVTLFAHFHVREDLQRLYGFSTPAERELFRQLIGVNMVGPKIAISILSHISVKEFIHALSAQNAALLKSVPGVGLKTAQRLIMELKGKVNLAPGEMLPHMSRDSRPEGAIGTVQSEATDALISLGYSEQQVQRALMRVREVIDPAAPVEEWIKKALQVV